MSATTLSFETSEKSLVTSSEDLNDILDDATPDWSSDEFEDASEYFPDDKSEGASRSLYVDVESVSRGLVLDAIQAAVDVINNQNNEENEVLSQFEETMERLETFGSSNDITSTNACFTVKSPSLAAVEAPITKENATNVAQLVEPRGNPQDDTRSENKSTTRGSLGISLLPNLVKKRYTQRGFDFKLLIMGESGIGKTTLIDSLFNVESTRVLGPVSSPQETFTANISESFFQLSENNFVVRLTVVDTPGYKDSLTLTPILNYLDTQMENYFELETSIQRRTLTDSRVHCIIYVVNPSCRGLKPLDVLTLQCLQHRANLLIVIGKADSLTVTEKASLKAAILRDLDKHDIEMYQLPDLDDESDDDLYLQHQHQLLRNSFPLAVIGSTSFVLNEAGILCRGRQYDWGAVDISNPDYSDFLKLRELLVMYMEDMKESTHSVIYEKYRQQLLKTHGSALTRMTQTLTNQEAILLAKNRELKRLKAEVAALRKIQTLPASVKHNSIRSSRFINCDCQDCTLKTGATDL